MKRCVVALACFVGLSACGHLEHLDDPQELGARLSPDQLPMPEHWSAKLPQSGKERSQQAAYYLIGVSDQQCFHYLTGIGAQSRTADAGLGWTSLLLGTIGGLAGSTDGANIFSAGSTFLQSTNRTLRDTVFEGNEWLLIQDAVWKGRDRERALLYAEIKSGAFDALGDFGVRTAILPYDEKCGIAFGTMELQRALAATGGPTIPTEEPVPDPDPDPAPAPDPVPGAGAVPDQGGGN